MQNACSGCGRELQHKELVTTLIPGVEISVNKKDESKMRLKLANGSIDSRTTMVFCQNCLQLKDFGV